MDLEDIYLFVSFAKEQGIDVSSEQGGSLAYAYCKHLFTDEQEIQQQAYSLLMVAQTILKEEEE
jgi:hypothetical protein